MIISCERCQARFRLADEKLKPGGTRVRCSKCQHVFTVMPLESAPVEETIDFGDFNMERVGDEEAASPPPLPEFAPSVPGDDAEAESGAREFDFGAVAATAEPAIETGAFAGETTGEATHESPTFAEFAPETTPELFGEPDLAEENPDRDASGPAAAFDIDASPPADDEAIPGQFSFETATAADAADFVIEPAGPGPEDFPPAADTEKEPFDFDVKPEPAARPESFSFDEEGEGALFEGKPAFGEEDTAAWGEPAAKDLSFDFDEPSFGSEPEKPLDANGGRGELGFGEIDFGEAPQFPSLPEPSAAPPARPSHPEAAPPVPPPPPRPAAPRPRPEEPLPVTATPPKRSISKGCLLFVLLLLLVCGAGGYFYLMGGGEQIIERFMATLKGETPAVVVEQRIGLSIAGSSYIDNREAGQLLVIQGSATNNFAGVRSAITVKGVLIDANGKVLQQQTVFCGNYLSDEKLRTMKYAQIEEAMNNQFGDSLANMNVKPGAVIRFTIVFRNLPQNLANINVEVVDSKPGGL